MPTGGQHASATTVRDVDTNDQPLKAAYTYLQVSSDLTNRPRMVRRPSGCAALHRLRLGQIVTDTRLRLMVRKGKTGNLCSRPHVSMDVREATACVGRYSGKGQAMCTCACIHGGAGYSRYCVRYALPQNRGSRSSWAENLHALLEHFAHQPETSPRDVHGCGCGVSTLGII